MSTLQTIPGIGVPWPPAFGAQPLPFTAALSSTGLRIDATGEIQAQTGYVFWEGGAASKAVSKIHFGAASCTFNNGSSVMRVGVQDLAAAAGPPGEPDGTFDMYIDVTGGGGVLTGGAGWKSLTLDTGSKTLSTGDKIAVVWDFTTRAGADSLEVSGWGCTGNLIAPLNLQNLTGTWAIGNAMLNVILEASDGTLGHIAGAFPFTSLTTFTRSSASNPDEDAFVFQLPVEMKVRGVVPLLQMSANNSDIEVNIFSDPFGTPTLVTGTNLTRVGYQGGGSNRVATVLLFPAEVTLSASTDYALAVRATGAGNVSSTYYTLRNAADRPMLGLTDCGRATRDGGSGAFSAISTTTVPQYLLLVSSLHDGTGGGGGTTIAGTPMRRGMV